MSRVIGRPGPSCAPRAPREVVDQHIERDAARRLDEDDIAGREHDAGAPPERRRVSIGDHDDRGAGGEPAALGAAGDAPRRRATVDHDDRERWLPRPRPTSRWPVACASPSSSISPRTAMRRPGKPARTSSAARIESGDGVVGVVEDRATARRATASPRCGADQPPRRRVDDRRRGPCPAARPTAAAASALWTDCRPSVGTTGARSPPGRREVKRMPSRRPRLDVLGAHVGVRRSRSGGREPRVRSRHPRDARVVRVEDRRRRRPGRASTSSPLACSIASSDPDPREVDRLDRRDDADRGAGRCAARSRDVAAHVHAHLEHGGLVLGPQAQQRSAAGRSRCSGCPRCAASASAAPSTAAICLLGGGLGDAARSRRRRAGRSGAPGRRHAPAAPRSRRRPRTTVTSPRASSTVAGGRRRHEQRRRAGRDGRAEEAVAVGALAGQRDEELARVDEPGVDRRRRGSGRPAGASRSRPPVRRPGRRRVESEASPGDGSAPDALRPRARRRVRGHRRTVGSAVAGRGRPSHAGRGVGRLGAAGRGRASSIGVVRDPPEELERHHRHLELARRWRSSSACLPRSEAR